jgi:hypothetical protein
MTARVRGGRPCREQPHVAHRKTDNTKRTGSRPRPATGGAESLTLYLPSGLANGPGLTYAVGALLRPLGLAVNVASAADQAPVELAWAGRSAPRVAVDRPRLEAAFAALSGQRELDAPRDRLGRVARPPQPLDDILQPSLSLWASQLAAALAAANPAWRRPKAGWTVHLTHDVDRVRALEPMGVMGRAARVLAGLVRFTVEPAREMARWVRHAREFPQTFQAVMELERQAGARATYFVMPGPYSLRRYGARTGANSRRMTRLLELARQFGHRIGLHGCAYGIQEGNYARQRQRLSELAGAEVTWHSNHYLVYDPRQSPALLESAGVRVDSTVGFHQANGFRAGLAWPYRLWNWTEGGPGRIVELPMVFMDGVRRRSDDQEWDELLGLLERTAAVGGAVAVNLHVDYFLGRADRLERYRRLLSWLGERHARLSDDLSAFGA